MKTSIVAIQSRTVRYIRKVGDSVDSLGVATEVTTFPGREAWEVPSESSSGDPEESAAGA